MFKKLNRNKRGVLYVYVVLMVALAAGVFFGFLFMNVIGTLQESINPLVGSEEWATTAHDTVFYYAATFITNIWQYIIVLVVFIVAYWAYIYQQRKGAGYP